MGLGEQAVGDRLLDGEEQRQLRRLRLRSESVELCKY
jgi:hypothetical protein